MKYKLEYIGRQDGCFDSWHINGYEIALEFTVGAGIRVNIRRPPDLGWLKYWFSEPDPDHLLRLVNVAIELIENNSLDQAPQTTKRPYILDEAFCSFIEPYKTTYIKKLDNDNIVHGWFDVASRFFNKIPANG